ncbi:flagellar protein FliT [Clostridium sp. HMP27]|uniref:flagellar protein FliT n=1 Tax=Clostridium sp. HMP27 TaxID=1487921 RepID=UPI00052E3252|nr:flagellar protein FliT [Clostridium sp. HMP27]KGK86057.1 hypothetical protein DP68_14630 [Clostridium sp. HMP27]
MNLDDFMEEYKKISLEIKKSLDNDDLDSLEILLEGREKVIESLDIDSFDREELKKIYEKYEIYELDQLIFEEIKLQKNQMRNKIFEVEKQKKMRKGYNNLNAKAVFLTKEI